MNSYIYNRKMHGDNIPKIQDSGYFYKSKQTGWGG